MTGGRPAGTSSPATSTVVRGAMGRDGLGPHDERYAVADEFPPAYRPGRIWEDGGTARQGERALRRPEQGPRHRLPVKALPFPNTIHATETSPQRTPVIFQAGASERVAASPPSMPRAFTSTAPLAGGGGLDQIANFRKRVADAGRDPQSVKVSPASPSSWMTPRRPHEHEYKRYTSVEGLMALMSGAMGNRPVPVPLDEPLEFQENDANRKLSWRT